jgi:hypothetical protein
MNTRMFSHYHALYNTQRPGAEQVYRLGEIPNKRKIIFKSERGTGNSRPMATRDLRVWRIWPITRVEATDCVLCVMFNSLRRKEYCADWNTIKEMFYSTRCGSCCTGHATDVKWRQGGRQRENIAQCGHDKLSNEPSNLHSCETWPPTLNIHVFRVKKQGEYPTFHSNDTSFQFLKYLLTSFYWDTTEFTVTKLLFSS